MKQTEILKFLHEAENLKMEMRHSWMSNGRQESVAEHSWRLSFMAILMVDKLDRKIDLLKVLKMITIHDINEAYVGDVPIFDTAARAKQQIAEKNNIEKLKKDYNSPSMNEIYALWQEFEARESLEAKFVHALDRTEVKIQHNEAKIETWDDGEYVRSQFSADKYCKHDDFLNEFNELLKKEARDKITEESDKDLSEIIAKAKKVS